MRLTGKSTHPEVKAENAFISAPALPSILAGGERGGQGMVRGRGRRRSEVSVSGRGSPVFGWLGNWPFGFSLDSSTHVTTRHWGSAPFSQNRSAVGALESSCFHLLMLQ